MSLLISIEGFDGVGKSTQAKLLNKNLESMNIDSICVREPGGTELAEKIRDELSENIDLGSIAELLLFEAARADLVQKVIKPKLNEGTIVITDRYIDSTLAYQGFGRGIELSKIIDLNELSSIGVIPDITFLLDTDIKVALERAKIRNNTTNESQINKFEEEALDFHKRVREGFLQIANKNPERIIILNSSSNISELSENILNIVKEKLAMSNK
tara:strand:+ start:381 stop:1022 length:642 start_codon:yes stop_codon:yes gene_type:complete